MIRTVIFGGSFDPVHKGHEDIIRKLSERFDEVIVVPTAVSPFKQGHKAASAELRMAMLNLCDFPPNVTVSDYEINKSGVSYSIDTVRHFSAEDRELYFAIGSEGARSVPKWRNSDQLRRLCRFYVIGRPGYDDGVREDDFIQADFCGEDVSSSEVKVAVALNRAEELVSKGVAEIIKANDLYGEYRVYTREYATFGLKKERIEHTYRATVEGIKLAKRYDADVTDCTIAMLLHDIGKYVTPEMLVNLNIPVPDTGDLPEPCVHAEYGAAICEHYFKLKREIVDAVRTHTTCSPDMGKLGAIVALADYIEPGRKFTGVEKVREAAKKDLDLAVEIMLEKTLSYLGSRGVTIAPVTVTTYLEYKQNNARRGVKNR